MPLSVGDKLGPYEILAPIGAGGMGEVYRGHDTRLGRDIAIKVLPEHFVTPLARERFLREARACSGLSHPNICAIHDLGEFDGTSVSGHGNPGGRNPPALHRVAAREPGESFGLRNPVDPRPGSRACQGHRSSRY